MRFFNIPVPSCLGSPESYSFKAAEISAAFIPPTKNPQ